MIEQAATLNGLTVTEFVTTTLIEKSREVIERSETRILTDRDRDIILSLLESPPVPGQALRKAAGQFNNAVRDGSLKL